MQQLGDSTGANLKDAAANTGAKFSETGVMLNKVQSQAGMPADSLIDKIGRSFRERAGSVGVNGEPSTILAGRQKASVPFQQKQPAPQKTKQAAAAPTKTEPAAPTLTQPKLDKTALSLGRSNSTHAKAGATAGAKTGAKAGAPVDSLNSDAKPAAGGGSAVDSLVDRLGAKFRGSGGSVGANGAPSTGILGSNSPPAAPAPPKTTRPAASAPVDKVNAPGQKVNAAGRTDAQLATHPAAPAPPKTTKPAASAPVDKVNASGQRVNAAGRTDAQLAKMEGESQAKARYASQDITGVREVPRTANVHELASGVARFVDKPTTAVSKAGSSLNNLMDRVTDQPMDGSRR